ncbi:hypothetical protein ACG2LH_02485 [Zhouia sp. PK063]|uniref:hypothetical protein n=1 Tax=Zhouia sp. PK063 TaxID=3373602 RepID=UPI0037B29E28
MKTKSFIIIAVAAISSLVSCDKKPSKDAQEFNTLFKEVIEVHDEVMPKMEEMGKLSKELAAKIDTTTTDGVYQKALDSLTHANKEMMMWMKDFSDKFPYAKDRLKGKTEDEIKESVAALKEEKKEVDAVKNHVNGSIENAKTVLQ